MQVMMALSFLVPKHAFCTINIRDRQEMLIILKAHPKKSTIEQHFKMPINSLALSMDSHCNYLLTEQGWLLLKAFEDMQLQNGFEFPFTDGHIVHEVNSFLHNWLG